MTHECIKTGCLCYLEDYNLWVYGDAHMIGDVLCIRVAEQSLGRINGSNVHFTIRQVDYWPDQRNSKVEYSMLLATKFVNHGYYGLAISERPSTTQENSDD